MSFDLARHFMQYLATPYLLAVNIAERITEHCRDNGYVGIPADMTRNYRRRKSDNSDYRDGSLICGQRA
jgi:hypothetical protein